MEAFKKWYKENIEPYLPKKRPSVAAIFKEARKNTWKAALEWVLSWETDHESREIITKELSRK